MKEKFVRTRPKRNIGEIGVEPTSDRLKFAAATVDFVIKNGEEYRKSVLQRLIGEYGEEEGKRQFDMMMLAATDNFKELESMITDSNEDVKTSGLRK